jgi:sensor histidine kinase YesM
MREQKNHSIRSRLLNSFFLTAALMCIMVMYSFISINSIALSITSAYRTNVMLDEYQKALGKVEASLETYISFHTFGSIENYYSWRGKLDTLSLRFTTTLSSDPILLLEYKVKKIMETFLEYADKAVYARRGNDDREYVYNYNEALRVYEYLSNSVNELNALFLVGVIGINFLMVYILITKITGPLVDLSNAANELAKGNFDVGILEIQAQDEVGNICRAFDRMTVSIRQYIDTIRAKAMIENKLRQQEMEMRELYKDAQLKTLQAQINPHFLFNTLNAGAQLAMMEGADNTCTFIEKTADFFRYNIQKMDKDTRLSEDLELVDNYMYIMKVRFADRLSYVKKIECDDLDIPMPSMILQPLVENSIKHGIADMKSGGTISLRVFRDHGILYIEISDNGVGIASEMREQLLHGSYFYEENTLDRNQQSPSVGIGMINVITRLRVFFDDNQIFDIRSNEPDPGTTFSVRIKNV